MISGVFFPATCDRLPLGGPFDFHVLLEELLSSPSHGAYIEPEKLGDLTITAASRLQRLEPGVQASLLLIEQAEEQNDGRSQLVRQDGSVGHRPGHTRLGKQGAACQQLLASATGVRRAVQEPPRDLLASQTSV